MALDTLPMGEDKQRGQIEKAMKDLNPDSTLVE